MTEDERRRRVVRARVILAGLILALVLMVGCAADFVGDLIEAGTEQDDDDGDDEGEDD